MDGQFVVMRSAETGSVHSLRYRYADHEGQGSYETGLRVVRQRYFVFVSVLYLVVGSVIVVRSAVAHVVPLMFLGIVFLALGGVRLRDYFRGRGGTR